MKKQLYKGMVYFGIFSILIFPSFQVLAMNGGGHGMHDGGRSSGGGMHGDMGDERYSGFRHMDQDMNRYMDRSNDYNMNRYMDRNMDHDLDRRMDQDVNRHMERDMNQDINRHMDQGMN